MATLDELEKDAARRKHSTAWPELVKKIAAAMSSVEQRDRQLLESDDNERAVAHRLAVYLEQELADDFWHVDCDFTRQGKERVHKDVASSALLTPSKEGGDRRLVRPDIIVHRRGPSGPNLLVIEVKPVKPARDRSIRQDIAKLGRFLTEAQLKYTYAVLVTYRFGDEAGFEEMRPVVVKTHIRTGAVITISVPLGSTLAEKSDG